MPRRFPLILVGLGLGLAGCVAPGERVQPSARTASELARPVTWDGFDPQLVSDAIFLETNRVRRSFGLRALKPSPALNAAASLHASVLALTGQSGHENPLPGQYSPYDRTRAAGIIAESVSENVATSPLRLVVDDNGGRVPEANRKWPNHEAFARRVVQQWLDSPHHRVNLLDPKHTHLACGAALARSVHGAELGFSVQMFMVHRVKP